MRSLIRTDKGKAGISRFLSAGILLILLTAYIGWMLSLPCFPSADGPVHLYYAHVLGGLLRHRAGPFTAWFRIRHLLPPYALYYYLLLALGAVMPLQTADRVIICLYFVSFAFGFRYLARAIGPAARWLSPLALLLLLNWPLGMGFVNFCLSLSFALWAAGLWLRFAGRPGLAPRAAFLVLVVLITLTHPVPLLLLLVVAGAAFLTGVLSIPRTKGRWQLPPHGVTDLTTLLLAALSLVYVKLFTVAHPLAQTPDIQPVSYWAGVAHSFTGYAREHALAFVLGSGLAVDVYRTGLLLCLVVTASLAMQQRLRNWRAKVWTAGDTFLALGLLLAVGLPFIPSKLNGLYYFADRLVLCVWLALLLAAAGWRGATAGGTRRVGIAVVALGTVCSLASLIAANQTVRPPAEAIAALGAVKLPPGQVGFLFEDSRAPRGGARRGLSWNPFYWATIGIFRENNAVLANAPWMDETILPVGDTSALPEEHIRALQEPLPTKLQGDLLRSPAEREAALQAADFFAVDAEDRPALDAPEPLLAGHEEEWQCSAEGWLRLCRKLPRRLSEPVLRQP